MDHPSNQPEAIQDAEADNVSPTLVLSDAEIRKLLALGLEAGRNGSPTVREIPRLADVWKSQIMPGTVCVQFINNDDAADFLCSMRNVLLLQRECNR